MTDSTILRSRGRARERKKKRSSKWAIEQEGEKERKEREGREHVVCGVKLRITHLPGGYLRITVSEWVTEGEDAYTVINSEGWDEKYKLYYAAWCARISWSNYWDIIIMLNPSAPIGVVHAKFLPQNYEL